MQKTTYQQRYVKYSGRIIILAVAMIILLIIFCSATLACIKVYEVSIYAGKTRAEANAHEYDGEIMYIPIDSEAYFYAEIDDVCNPDWKDYEWQLDFDSDSVWDFETLTYYLFCQPYPPWTYDTAGWYYPRVKVGLEDVPDSDAQDTCQVAVVTVTNLVWQTYPGNTPLAGGKIFPGKKTYDDEYGPDRRKVKVKATLNMSPDASDNIYVRFKCWDVDDPSADSAPIDEDDDDPDPNKHSMDNNGYFYFEGINSSISVLADGSVVYATFLVSMNPGDNYRITATTSQEANDDLTHYKVETGNIPSSVKRTSILTTWRKLWIEQDSMEVAATTGSEMNHVEGTAMDYDPYEPPPINRTWIYLGQNLPGAFDDEDQFRVGRYIAGGTTYTSVKSTAYLLNYDKVKVVGDATGAPMSFTLYDDDEGSYSGGAWTINPLLPSYPSLGSWDSSFHKSCIQPNYLPESYRDEVPFDRNLSTSDVAWGFGSWNNQCDCPSSSSFWTVLAVGSFQPETGNDNDPDGEERILGAAKVYLGDNQCVLYYETIKDGFVTDAEQDLAHEIGHCAGIEDNSCEVGCLMWVDQNNQLGDHFCDKCLLEMRKDASY